MSDDTSLFYKHKHGRRFPVSLMALEVYGKNMVGASTDNEIYDVLITTMTSSCGVMNPDSEDVDYFISRLAEMHEKMQEKAEKGGEKGAKTKSFGTSFSEYLSGLSIASTLLKMTGYDMDAATKLYCELDRVDVLELVNDYFSGKAEENLVAMEAAMYGSGNSYKKDKGSAGPARTHDLSSKEGIKAVRAMGL